jgi:uncharacterized protein (TIRG00374 family)
MRKKLATFILFASGIVLFIFTLKTVGLPQIKNTLSLLNFWQLILCLVTIFLGIVGVGAFKWWIIIKNNTTKAPKLSKIFWIKWIGCSISYLTPAPLFGGEPVRFYILKKDSEIPSSTIVSSIILDKLTLVLISSIYFFLGIFFLLFYLNLSWLREIIFFGILFFAILIFWYLLRTAGKISSEKGLFIILMERLSLDKLKFVKKHEQKILEIEKEIVDFFKLPKKIIFQIVFLAATEVALVLAACWLIVFFMGQTLKVPKLFAIKSIVDLSYVVPFPAALGSLEISQAFVFQALGFSLATGVGFSLILRGLNIIIAFLGLLVLACFQFKLLGKRIVNFFSKFLSI